MKKNIMWGLKTLAQMLALGAIFVLAALTIKWWGPVVIATGAIIAMAAGAYITAYELKTGKKFPKTEDEMLRD